MDAKELEEVARFYATATPDEIAIDGGRIANYALKLINPDHVELVPPRRFQMLTIGLRLGEHVNMEVPEYGEVIPCYCVKTTPFNILEEDKPCARTYL